eukprot:Nk52_evm46s212 gene=Nk52_evmTU46s212
MPFLVGFVRTEEDANLCFRAAFEGKIPLTKKRLTKQLQKEIGPNQIYVYDEIQSDICRWTDGRHWGASFTSGQFIVYKEATIAVSDGKMVKVEKENGLRKKIIADAMEGSCLRLVCYTDASAPDLRTTRSLHLETFRVSMQMLQHPIIGGLNEEGDDHSSDPGAAFYEICSPKYYPDMMESLPFENIPCTRPMRVQSDSALPPPVFMHSQVNRSHTRSPSYPVNIPCSASMSADSSVVNRLPYEQCTNSTSTPFSSIRGSCITSFPHASNTPQSLSGFGSTENLSTMFDSFSHSREYASVSNSASGIQHATVNIPDDIIANQSSPLTESPGYNQASRPRGHYHMGFSGMHDPTGQGPGEGHL